MNTDIRGSLIGLSVAVALATSAHAAPTYTIHAPNGVRQVGVVLTTVLISVMLTFSPYIETAWTYSGREVHLYNLDISARVNTVELYAAFSSLLLLFHKGVKGRKMNRWFFYIFYPAHILLLWVVHTVIFK